MTGASLVCSEGVGSIGRVGYFQVEEVGPILRAAQDRLVVMKPAGWEVDQDKQQNAAASTALKLSSFMCRGTRKSCKIQGGVKDDVISDGFFTPFKTGSFWGITMKHPLGNSGWW